MKPWSLLSLVLVVMAMIPETASAEKSDCRFRGTAEGGDLGALRAAARDAGGKATEKLLALAKARTAEDAETDPTEKAKKKAVRMALEEEQQAQAALAEKLSAMIAALRATNAIDVKTGGRIALRLASPPSTRLRVSFDTATGQHQEVEWDPAVSTDLTRFVTLDRADGWQVTVAAEASPFSQQQGTILIQPRFGLFETSAPTSQQATLEGSYVMLSAALNSDKSTPTDRELTSWPRPRLTFDCGLALPAIEAVQFPTARTSGSVGGLRGFGVAPTFVTDTLSILAEIAIDRARAGALQLLKRKLVDPFCADASTRVTLDRLGLGHSDGLALPRTCELLEQVRLDDVLSSGRPMLLALRDDVRHVIVPAVVQYLAQRDPIARPALEAILTVLDAAVDRGSFEGIEGQLLLELMGAFEKMVPALSARLRAKVLDEWLDGKALSDLQAILTSLGGTCGDLDACRIKVEAAVDAYLAHPIRRWRDVMPPAIKDQVIAAVRTEPTTRRVLGYGCQARLVVAVVKQCSKGDCAVRDIAGWLGQPDQYFQEETELPYALCWEDHRYLGVPDDVAAAQQLVLDGLQLVAPVVDGRGTERAKAAVRLVVKLVRRARGTGGDDACPGCLDAVAEVAIAMIDEDHGTALGRFLRLMSELRPHRVPKPLRNVVALLGAVASYASVYRATKDDDPKAAREARKRALSSILDSLTDRTDRGDEPIVSVGSNVGFSATWTNPAFTDQGAQVYSPGVRLPMSLRVEWLPLKNDGGFGGHVAFQLVDLGQFVRRNGDGQLDDLSWADFLSPGIEVGFTHARVDRAANISLHGAYAPSIAYDAKVMVGGDETTVSKQGVWRFGVSLGYYVPFFDLN